MNKSNRHSAIAQIIADKTISSQEELCEELERKGFEITQATLSRDLKELGIYRFHAPDGLRYVAPTKSGDVRLKTLLEIEIESVFANETLVILKTLPGRAQGAAEMIDHWENPHILGTLAGDNTIFIAPVSTQNIPDILSALKELIGK